MEFACENKRLKTNVQFFWKLGKKNFQKSKDFVSFFSRLKISELGDNSFILILLIVRAWSSHVKIRVWRQTCNYSESLGEKRPKIRRFHEFFLGRLKISELGAISNILIVLIVKVWSSHVKIRVWKNRAIILKVRGKNSKNSKNFVSFPQKWYFVGLSDLRRKMFSVFELAKMLPIRIINTELHRRVLRALDGKNHQNPQNTKIFYGVWDFSLLLKKYKQKIAVRTSQNFQSKIKQFETIF